MRRNPNQKAKPVAPRLPVGASVLSTVATTSATIEAPFVPAATSTFSNATISAAPVLISNETEKDNESDRVAQGWMKKIKPPSMVLDEDVNGFKDKSRKAGGHGKSKGKGKKKVCHGVRRVISIMFTRIAEQECARRSSLGPDGAVQPHATK